MSEPPTREREDGAAPTRTDPVAVDDGELAAWCGQWLGGTPIERLFATGNLSAVRGLRLDDGRAVVVKVRPHEARLAGCAVVQHRLWQAGFPCPQPLSGPHPLGEATASAEMLVEGGGPLDTSGVADADTAQAYAALLADLIRAAPNAADVPSLAPAPAWMRWYHDEPGVWPPPDDRPDDLNQLPETAWLDEYGARARRRLARLRKADRVVGHCDWEAQNIRWRDGRAWSVDDWDSAVAEPETVIVGQAAAVWPAGTEVFGATPDQTDAFLEAYQRARDRAFTPAEVEEAWAAGLWVRSFNGKKFLIDGLDTLGAAEAEERARRAGAV